MNELELRDLLDRAPAAPADPGYGARLAASAHRLRARRRRVVALGTVVATAAAMAALTLGPALLTGPSVTTPAPTPSTTPDTPDPRSDDLGCRGGPRPAAGGDPVVPAGAVAARLCGGMIDNGGFDMAWPADTLRGPFLGRLLDHVSSLEPYVEPDGCTLPYSPPFTLVLAYPDGTRLRLQGDTAGSCEHVTVPGGGAWSGAPALLDRALGLVRDQRAAVRGPGDRPVEAASCPQWWQDVTYTDGAAPVSPETSVAITACRYRLEFDPDRITQSADGTLETQVDVTGPGAMLREAARGSRVDPCGGVAYDLEPVQDVLLVRDRYGDVQVVPTAPCWPSMLTGARLYPSAGLAAAVADQLG